MPVLDRTARWTTAAGLVLGPSLLLLVPSLLPGADHSSAEAQMRFFAAGGDWSTGLLLQVAGTVALLLAAAGGLVVLLLRRRGTVLGVVAAVLGTAGAVGLLLALGVELAQVHLLTTLEDTERAVDLALALNDSPVFTAVLLGGLAALFVLPPVLALALWRGRMVPLALPLLFLLPVAVGFVPLPAAVASVLPAVLLLVPCLWAAERLLRAGRGLPAGSPADDRTAVGALG